MQEIDLLTLFKDVAAQFAQPVQSPEQAAHGARPRVPHGAGDPVALRGDRARTTCRSRRRPPSCAHEHGIVVTAPVWRARPGAAGRGRPGRRRRGAQRRRAGRAARRPRCPRRAGRGGAPWPSGWAPESPPACSASRTLTRSLPYRCGHHGPPRHDGERAADRPLRHAADRRLQRPVDASSTRRRARPGRCRSTSTAARRQPLPGRGRPGRRRRRERWRAAAAADQTPNSPHAPSGGPRSRPRCARWRELAAERAAHRRPNPSTRSASCASSTAGLPADAQVECRRRQLRLLVRPAAAAARRRPGAPVGDARQHGLRHSLRPRREAGRIRTGRWSRWPATAPCR